MHSQIEISSLNPISLITQFTAPSVLSNLLPFLWVLMVTIIQSDSNPRLSFPSRSANRQPEVTETRSRGHAVLLNVGQERDEIITECSVC